MTCLWEGGWFSGDYFELFLSKEREVGNTSLLKSRCSYQRGRMLLTGLWACFGLAEVDSWKWCLDWTRSRRGRLGNKETGAAFAAGWENTFYPLFSLTNANWGVLQEELVSLGEFGTYRQDHMLYSIGFGFLKILSQRGSIGCFGFSVVRLQMDLKFMTLRYNPGRLMLQTICSLLTCLVL